MTRRILRSWVQRPHQAVRIRRDWQSSVLFAFTGAPHGIDVATGQVLTQYSQPSYTAEGLACASYGDGMWRLMGDRDKTSEYTVLILARRIGAATAYASFFAGSYAGNDTSPYGDQLDYDSSSGADLRFAYNAGGSPLAISASGQGISTSAFEWVAATFKPGAQRLYKNGALVATASNSGAPAWSGTSRLTVGQSDDLGGRIPATVIAYALRLNYAATQDEIAALMADPWQVFEPQAIYVKRAAGGAAVLAAGLAGQASMAAALSTGIRLQAAPAATAAAVASLSTAIRLAATPTAASTLAAALSTSIRLAAARAAVSTITASLTTAVSLGASAAATSTLGAQLSTSIRLPASLASYATITAALATTPQGLAAALGSQSSLGAGLTTAIRAAAAMAGVSTLTASLAAGAAQFTAGIAAQAAISAQLSTGIRPAGIADGCGDAGGGRAVLGPGWRHPRRPNVGGIELHGSFVDGRPAAGRHCQ